MDTFHSPDPRERTDPRLRIIREEVEDTAKHVKQFAGVLIAAMLMLGGFAGFVLSASKAIAQDAGTKAAHVEEQLVKHEMRNKEDLHELQTDVRALYKAVMTGARQERLEKPPATDGGR